MSEGKIRGGRLALQVAAKLRSRIERMQPGEPVAPEQQLARELRCSVTTVRSAMAMLVDESRLRRRRGAGTYVDQPRGRAAGNLTGVLFYGSVARLLRVVYTREMFLGVLEEADAAGRQVHLMPMNRDKPAAVRMADLHAAGVPPLGALLCVETFNRDMLRMLGGQTTTVALDVDCREPGVSSCSIDHADCMRQLMYPLWQLGHRRIAMIGPIRHPTDPAHVARREAFIGQARELGITVHPQWLTHVPDSGGAAMGIESLLAIPADRRPTAIVCVVPACWSLLRELWLRGVRVPEQMSVVALDVGDHWPAWAPPRAFGPRGMSPLDDRLAPLRMLTPMGLRLPFHQMGQWAIREVVRRQQAPSAAPEHVTFKAEFLSGNTIAAPPAARPQDRLTP